jgi:serine-type D-Ala-D-Ala carboxypeptidase/endopeptidase (penicillin-binding protein 4)
MRKLFFVLFCCIGYICTSTGNYKTFNTSLNSLLDNAGENLNIGIIITDPRTEKILFSYNPDRYFYPASILKIITAYSATHFLGRLYRYKTSLLIDGKIQQGNLIGNAYLKFSGDPTLTIGHLNELINQLSAQNIRRITGNVFLDDSDQDLKLWPIGTVLEDTKFCFAAPISAIIINKNCVNVFAKITPKKNVTLISEEASFVQLNNHLHFRPSKIAMTDLQVHQNNRFNLTGHLNQDTPFKIAVQDNRLFAKQIIEHLLKERNITITSINYQPTPVGLKPLAVHQSESIENLITIMLKESDNIIANAIFRTIASKRLTESTWETASINSRRLLTTLGLNSKMMSLHDGAGNSIYDRLSPKDLISLLNYIYKTNDYSFFKSALPHAGIDGTLRNRMTKHPINLYAKTGTATGSSSLAGYIETKQHHLLTFVIMINNGVQPITQYKVIEDAICNAIHNHL